MMNSNLDSNNKYTHRNAAIKVKMCDFLSCCHSAKVADWLIFCIFAVGVFLQCVLFHYFAFHSIVLSSLWKTPFYFVSFYLPKLSIALLLGSFVFLFRRKYWTIYASVLINLWILAEIIYYRSTHIFIDVYSFRLMSELNGFESSIGMYLDWNLLLFLIPTLLTIIGVLLFNNRNRSPRRFTVVLCVGIFCNVLTYQVHYQYNDLKPMSKQNRLLPMLYICDMWGFNLMEVNSYYAQEFSVLHAAGFNIVAAFYKNGVTVTPTDKERLKSCLQESKQIDTPKRPLIMVLVESMESWVIQPSITPNLCRFIGCHSIVQATKVKSQTKRGNSGDGQMIYNTGLLPIIQGVACMMYADDVFPSLSELYSSTALIQPGKLDVWNQQAMNRAYHIDTTYIVPSAFDHDVFNTLDTICSIGQYDYILVITIASHSPFVACSHFSSLSLPDDMPANMRNYLLCMNYTDSCWGDFLQRIDTDSVLHNSVVCFMGDHIIFDPIMRKEFQDYCDRAGLDYQPQEAYTAFVAYSPDLTEKTIINEVTYQMDAYPTIRHLIGADTYYWKGFGIDLSDTTHTMVRPINEQDAYIVSDKIIRANYFKEYLGR